MAALALRTGGAWRAIGAGLGFLDICPVCSPVAMRVLSASRADTAQKQPRERRVEDTVRLELGIGPDNSGAYRGSSYTTCIGRYG